MTAQDMPCQETAPPSLDGATICAVEEIDEILRGFDQQDRLSAQIAAAQVRGVLDSFLEATFLDPLSDRALVIAWAQDAIRIICTSPLAQREAVLFALWLDSRLTGEIAIAQIEIKLDEMAETFQHDPKAALNMLTGWCSTTAVLPVLVADRLIDLAHEHSQVALLATMLFPGGLVSSRSFPLSVTTRVLDCLAHLAHHPGTCGRQARFAMVELAAWPDLAAHVALRLPAHLLDPAATRQLCAVIEQWDDFNASPEPWIAPDHIVLARLTLHAALARLVDAARLAP